MLGPALCTSAMVIDTKGHHILLEQDVLLPLSSSLFTCDLLTTEEDDAVICRSLINSVHFAQSRRKSAPETRDQSWLGRSEMPALGQAPEVLICHQCRNRKKKKINFHLKSDSLSWQVFGV